MQGRSCREISHLHGSSTGGRQRGRVNAGDPRERTNHWYFSRLTRPLWPLGVESRLPCVRQSPVRYSRRGVVVCAATDVASGGASPKISAAVPMALPRTSYTVSWCGGGG